ncbi:zinc finger protein GLIS2 homolog isoform X2 [Tribolium madens]|nr:zinc finger protein GLIS2 homolog isoform X2 [Tribolium madens]
MIEGQPLHYYYQPYPEYFYPYKMEINEIREDIIVPSSPNSTQSDSDNSLSSIEVSPKPIRARSVIQHTPKSPKTNEVRCGWKSCGITFDSLDQLASHVTKIHASSGPGGLFYCGWEGCSRNSKGFNARYKMLVHVRTHTNEKPHQCYQCDKSFSRAENLKIHSRSHSGEKPYVCPVPGCNKAYSNSSDRFKHTRTHQVEKPYQCKVPGCPKRYTDPSSLRKHVKTYKHFVDKVDENVKNNSIEKVQEAHSCDCTHMCCAGKDKVRFGGLIGYMTESPYFFAPQQEMDVDVPLDLSINRKV